MQVARLMLEGRRSHAALLAALLAVGCFSPELGSCLSCANGGACPTGQSCQGDVCVAPGQSPAACRLTSPPKSNEDVDTRIAGDATCGLGELELEAVPTVCTGSDVDIALNVAGGAAPYRWDLQTTSPGLTLAHDGSSSVAHLRGMLAEAGQRRLQVVVESQGAGCRRVFDVALEVREMPRIVAEPPVPCAGQSDYVAQLEAAGGDATSYQWSVSGLPGGLALDGDEIYSAGSGAVVLREPVGFTLSLSDGACGPVEQKVTWPANVTRECFTIQPPALAALCAGVEYQAQLSGSASDPEQRWEVVDELPAGLSFDPATATLSGVPEAAGQLHVRLTGSGGRVADRRYDLPLRDRCRFAYIAGDEGTLHLRDVFLSSGTDVVLPEALPAGQAVTDFTFSPDGEWLAFRAGVPDQLGLYLTRASAANPTATLVELECPGVNDVCGVIDYAWAPSSRALALMVHGDIAGTQDYLTGVDVEAPEAPWPFLTQDTDLLEPFVFGGELGWAGEGHVALIAADPFSAGQQVPFLVTLSSSERTFARGASLLGVPGGQLGLLPTAGGFMTFNGVREGVGYTRLDTLVTSAFVAGPEQRGPWLSPGLEFVARVVAGGRLQLLGLDGSVQDETEGSVCGAVVAWSPLAGGRQRIMCSSLDANGNAVSTDLTLIDYSSTGRRQSQAFIPELELGQLAGTRRALAASGDGFAFTMGDQLVLVDASQPQPITSARTMTLSGISDLQYAGDERLILQSGNELWLVNTGRPPIRRTLAGALPMPASALSAVACQEEYSLAPSRWCGATRSAGAFVLSNDAHTILFEDPSAGLWITDVEAEDAARQVTTDLAPCSGTVRAAWTKPCARAYAFQP